MSPSRPAPAWPVRRLEAELILGYHARLDIERIRPTVTVYGEVTLEATAPPSLLRFEAVLSGFQKWLRPPESPAPSTT